ncbi:hypothetical protein EJV44_12215 [Ancylobacter aquaticus]|nr:hypothetical protein EJV44_12215 [Ancylobacter aquaticus]
MTTREEAAEALAGRFSDTADWRRRVAEEHDSSANTQAAELLERLQAMAEAPDAIPVNALDALASTYDEGEPYTLSETASEIMRAIGFRSFPDSPQRVIDDLLHALMPNVSTQAAIYLISRKEAARAVAEQARMAEGRPANI